MRAIEFRGPSMSEPLENQQISLGNIELLVGQQPEFSVRLVKALKLVDFARSSARFSASLAARWRLCSSLESTPLGKPSPRLFTRLSERDSLRPTSISDIAAGLVPATGETSGQYETLWPLSVMRTARAGTVLS